MNPAWVSAAVNGAISAAAVTSMVAVLLRFAGHRLNASTRYVVWMATLLLTLILPLAYVGVKSTTRRVIDRQQGAASTNHVDRGLAAAAAGLPTAVKSSKWDFQPIRIPLLAWLTWFLRIWMIASLAMLLRLIVSWTVIQRRKFQARPLSDIHGQRIAEWLERCGSKRSAVIAVSDRISSPVAVGPFRPVILIPIGLLDNSNDEDLEQIGLHESAHLARRDDVAIIVQRLVEAVFVFHPVVRWITSRLDVEREIACDDFVVQLTGRPRAYAECLIRVAEMATGAATALLAAPATGSVSVLERRLDMLLDRTRRVQSHVMHRRFAGVLMLLLITFGAVVKAPQVLAFAVPEAAAAAFTMPHIPESLPLVQWPGLIQQPQANPEPLTTIFGKSLTASDPETRKPADTLAFASLFGPSTASASAGPSLTPGEIAAGIHGFAQGTSLNPNGVWQAQGGSKLGSQFNLKLTQTDLEVSIVPGSNPKYVDYHVLLQPADSAMNAYKGTGYFVAKMDSGKECRFDTEWLLTIVTSDRILGSTTSIVADSSTCEIQEQDRIRLDLMKVQ
jgi:beta-lactamase regulating signal transducer with metallopeptidase domain